MSPCPICQTEYIEGQLKDCPTCGWDLQPYPQTFSGQIPTVFLEKEQAKIAWVQQWYVKTQRYLEQLKESQLQVEQLSLELAQSLSQIQQLQQELDLSEIKNEVYLEFYKKDRSSFQLLFQIKTDLMQDQLSEIQEQIRNADRERMELQSQVQQLKQSQLQQQSRLTEIDEQLKSKNPTQSPVPPPPSRRPSPPPPPPPSRPPFLL